MSGYTPIFDSVFQGTLCGRWPDTGVWLCLLALADKNGHIDSTIPYIAAVTGIPAETLTECIGRFMDVDHASRTQTQEGRRLVLIDPARSWGWVVVNHGQYREKARKQMQQIAATESGKDAERKRLEREKKRAAEQGVQSCPAESGADRLSDSDSDKEIRDARGARLPVDFQLTEPRRRYAEAEGLDADRTHAAFCDYWRSIPGAKGKKLDWDATWRNWCRNDKNKQPKKTRGVQC